MAGTDQPEPQPGRELGPDFVGVRPQEREPPGLWELLCQVPHLMRTCPGHVFGLPALAATLALIVWIVAANVWLTIAPALFSGLAGATEVALMFAPLIGLLTVVAWPPAVGSGYALLRRLQGRRAGVWALFQPMVRCRRLGHLLLAVLALAVPMTLVNAALSSALTLGVRLWHGVMPKALENVGNLPGLRLLAGGLVEGVVMSALVPFGWAGLEIMVRRRNWLAALGASARLALRNPGLLAGPMGVVFFAQVALRMATGPHTRAVPVGQPDPGAALIWTLEAASLLGYYAFWMITVLAFALVYREMLWRERERDASSRAARGSPP